MDLSELVVSRRTVHNYKTAKVSDEVVVDALRLSLWAPNHKLTYPWVYFWIGPVTRAKLAELSVELKQLKEPLSEAGKEGLRQILLNPSHLILLGRRRESDKARQHEDYATLACSVQIATLFLWSHGVASKWSTGKFSTHSRTYEILGASANEIELEGALLIGVPAVMPAKSPRPPLEIFLRKLE